MDMSSGLAKTILQGKVKGGRRQGGQKKRLEDNNKEWTGLEFAKSQRAAENREKWRQPVMKSSVEPQRPSRLRDRWRWRSKQYHAMDVLVWGNLGLVTPALWKSDSWFLLPMTFRPCLMQMELWIDCIEDRQSIHQGQNDSLSHNRFHPSWSPPRRAIRQSLQQI